MLGEELDREKIALKEDIKLRVNVIIGNFRKKGLSLDKIAEALGAQEFLNSENQIRRTSKREKPKAFDIVAYIDYIYEIESKIGKKYKFPDSVDVLDIDIVSLDNSEFLKTESNGEVTRKQAIIEVLSELGINYSTVLGKRSSDSDRSDSYQIFLLKDNSILVFVSNSLGSVTRLVYGVTDFDMSNIENLASLDRRQFDKLKITQRKVNYPQVYFGGDERNKDADDKKQKLYKNRIKRSIFLTEEEAKEEYLERIDLFIEAYNKWLDGGSNVNFNIQWLLDNGYKSSVYGWSNDKFSNNGGIRYLFKITLDYIKKYHPNDTRLNNLFNDFKVEDIPERNYGRTLDSAKEELYEAYEVWQQGEQDKPFNYKWLRDNNYRGLYLWSQRNETGGRNFDDFYRRLIDGTVAKNFIQKNILNN